LIRDPEDFEDNWIPAAAYPSTTEAGAGMTIFPDIAQLLSF
jgi:hypothetical protein